VVAPPIILKPIWNGFLFLQGFTNSQEIIWVKDDASDAGGPRVLSAYEKLLIASNYANVDEMFNMNGLGDHVRRNVIIHPKQKTHLRVDGKVLNGSQKVVLLDMHLMRVYSKQTSSVGCLCAGTGTTVIAAIAWLRSVFACESDYVQFIAAKERIEAFIAACESEEAHLKFQERWRFTFIDEPARRNEERKLANLERRKAVKENANVVRALTRKKRKEVPAGKTAGNGEGGAPASGAEGDEEDEEENIGELVVPQEAFDGQQGEYDDDDQEVGEGTAADMMFQSGEVGKSDDAV
jgi:hypothetical protein